MKSYHSNVAIKSMADADLIIGRCVVFFVNFSKSMGWKFVVIKHWIHICQGVFFKSSIRGGNVMPFIVSIPAKASNIVFKELAHKIKSHSLNVHVNSKHVVPPSSINIDLINDLTHNFSQLSVMIHIDISSNPSFNCEIFVMRKFPNVV